MAAVKHWRLWEEDRDGLKCPVINQSVLSKQIDKTDWQIGGEGASVTLVTPASESTAASRYGSLLVGHPHGQSHPCCQSLCPPRRLRRGSGSHAAPPGTELSGPSEQRQPRYRSAGSDRLHWCSAGHHLWKNSFTLNLGFQQDSNTEARPCFYRLHFPAYLNVRAFYCSYLH